MPLQTSVTAAQVAAVHALVLAGVSYGQAAFAVGSHRKTMRRFMRHAYVQPKCGPRKWTDDEAGPLRAAYEGGVPFNVMRLRFHIRDETISGIAHRYGWLRPGGSRPVLARKPKPPRPTTERAPKKWVAPDRPRPPVQLVFQPVPDYATDTVVMLALPLAKIRPLDVIVAPVSMTGWDFSNRFHGQKTGAGAHRGGV
jgi:hypothetical protein